MDEQLDRYQPDEWSRDGVTTVRRPPERRFLKRSKEKWVAVAAKATMICFAVAAVSVATLPTTRSEVVQRTAVVDAGSHPKARSELRDVDADHWPKLIKFLERFPRDERVGTDFDPDPFT